jgi:hypothetical protein
MSIMMSSSVLALDKANVKAYTETIKKLEPTILQLMPKLTLEVQTS